VRSETFKHSEESAPSSDTISSYGKSEKHLDINTSFINSNSQANIPITAHISLYV